mmetsp:Transcript_4653/g.6991  ORF Transcript_4653/g.6991 Transcript_4653/m.6991 type:complete len:311 (-) Transcript_4653:475-1407(-)
MLCSLLGRFDDIVGKAIKQISTFQYLGPLAWVLNGCSKRTCLCGQRHCGGCLLLCSLHQLIVRCDWWWRRYLGIFDAWQFKTCGHAHQMHILFKRLFLLTKLFAKLRIVDIVGQLFNNVGEPIARNGHVFDRFDDGFFGGCIFCLCCNRLGMLGGGTRQFAHCLAIFKQLVLGKVACCQFLSHLSNNCIEIARGELQFAFKIFSFRSGEGEYVADFTIKTFVDLLEFGFESRIVWILSGGLGCLHKLGRERTDTVQIILNNTTCTRIFDFGELGFSMGNECFGSLGSTCCLSHKVVCGMIWIINKVDETS